MIGLLQRLLHDAVAAAFRLAEALIRGVLQAPTPREPEDDP